MITEAVNTWLPEKLESNLIVSTTINWEARKVIGTYGVSIFGSLKNEMNYCEDAIESESYFNVQSHQGPFLGSHFCWVDPREVETYKEVDAASDHYGANL